MRVHAERQVVGAELHQPHSEVVAEHLQPSGLGVDSQQPVVGVVQHLECGALLSLRLNEDDGAEVVVESHARPSVMLSQSMAIAATSSASRLP